MIYIFSNKFKDWKTWVLFFYVSSFRYCGIVRSQPRFNFSIKFALAHALLRSLKFNLFNIHIACEYFLVAWQWHRSFFVYYSRWVFSRKDLFTFFVAHAWTPRKYEILSFKPFIKAHRLHSENYTKKIFENMYHAISEYVSEMFTGIYGPYLR